MRQQIGIVMRPRMLEVCVDDPAGLAAAVRGGADRIELCAALALGGLTPSPGLMAAGAACGLPAHAMVRSRAGDFEVDAALVDAMRRDIDAARAAGLGGVVFAASTPIGALDETALRRLVGHAEGLDLTLHRAFDLAPDLGAALETAIGLGFHRVLTSGGAATAAQGAEAIAALGAQAAGRIVVMPGAGVTAQTVGALVARTGAREVHASCATARETPERLHAFGFAPPQMRATSAESVAALKAALATIPD